MVDDTSFAVGHGAKIAIPWPLPDPRRQQFTDGHGVRALASQGGGAVPDARGAGGQIGTGAAIGLRGVGRQEHAQSS
jgi:hypothetical protein